MTIDTRFEDIGARVKVRPQAAWRPPTWRLASAASRVQPAPMPRIDIRSDKKGEYFDLAVPEGVELEVIDTAPDVRHLLLLARIDEPRPHLARYLCGHDERNWFVAAIPESFPASTVAEAKVALQPATLRVATAHLPARKRTLRHNEVFRRQGEWFFIPAPDFEPDPKDFLLHNEPLRRDRRSKPHVAAEAVRSGGETRYQGEHARVNAGKDPARTKAIRAAVDGKTVTAAEKARLEVLYPEVVWRSVLVNPVMYVRGPIRHSDHATLNLKFWHRVVVNTEGLAAASSHLTFID